MAEIRATAAQAAAIKSRGGALLVSANAGSGKTRVLTMRLLDYINDKESPRSIEDFLVISYTRAAAAELRSRIGESLRESADSSPNSKRLRRQAALVTRAKISTIHGFCTDLLREKCHIAGLSPDFKIVDEDRRRQLRASALKAVLEERYEQREPSFLKLADSVGAGRDDKRLEKLVLSLHDKIQCHARPDIWMAEKKTEFLHVWERAEDTPWGKELLSGAALEATELAQSMERQCKTMSLPEYDYIYKAYGSRFEVVSASLRHFAKCCEEGWDAARATLPIEFPRLGSLRAPPDAELVKRIKSVWDLAKPAAKKIGESFSASSEKILADFDSCSLPMAALLKLTEDFDKRFSMMKRRRALVDYSDLEHFASKLLVDEKGELTAVAREVSHRFTEVMVDEYQDVSAVQESILRAVSDGGRKLFMVGDVKQSVYRFRLADPTIFISKYLSFKNEDEAGEGEARRVLLRENFRSHPRILSAANAVFSCCMSSALGEIDYDGDASLLAGLPPIKDIPCPEMDVLAMPSEDVDEGDDDAEESPNRMRMEAQYVALRIKTLIREGITVTEGDKERKANYGDVAILLRSANKNGGVFRRALSEQGVPVLAEQSGGFFREPEVSALISLLAIIDNPRQDVALISALRSPYFGFTADELSKIRLYAKDANLYEALLLSSQDMEKSREFLSLLKRLRISAPDVSLTRLMSEIYRELDVYAHCFMEKEGAEARRNLSTLSALASAFESEGYTGLRRFTERLRAMDERGEEPPRSMGDAQIGAVSVMSIHRSKGLEYPIVFLCDTARKFNKSDLKDLVLVHPELGLGPKVTDTERGLEYPSLPRLALSRRMLRETLSEEMRLLYVAMTRARERLFITAMPQNGAKLVESAEVSASFPMSSHSLLTMSSPAHWLIYAAVADGGDNLKLRLVSTEPDSGAEAESDLQREETGMSQSSYVDVLRESFEHSYDAVDATLPAKVSATELKALGERDSEAASLVFETDTEFKMPNFYKSAGPTATAVGTATHLALCHIDLMKCITAESLSAELLDLRAKGLLSEEEHSAVDTDSVLSFAQSATAKRILGAERVLREFPFTLLCPARRFFEDNTGAEVLLQGVVDCVIDEGDGLVIIDYKTDRVRVSQVRERAEQYKTQMDAYSYAMERIYGKAVKERIIYFLSNATQVRV